VDIARQQPVGLRVETLETVHMRVGADWDDTRI
jgi:hypothetical protein